MQQPFNPYFDPAKLYDNELIGDPIGQKLVMLWINETFSKEDANEANRNMEGHTEGGSFGWIVIPLVDWDEETKQEVFLPYLQFLEPYIEENEEMWICWDIDEETGELTSWWITGNNA